MVNIDSELSLFQRNLIPFAAVDIAGRIRVSSFNEPLTLPIDVWVQLETGYRSLADRIDGLHQSIEYGDKLRLRHVNEGKSSELTAHLPGTISLSAGALLVDLVLSQQVQSGLRADYPEMVGKFRSRSLEMPGANRARPARVRDIVAFGLTAGISPKGGR